MASRYPLRVRSATIRRESFRHMRTHRCHSNVHELHGSAEPVPQRNLHEYLAAVTERAEVRAGSPLPLGTQERSGGVNFSIFSRNASGVRLELFNHANDA